MSAFPELFTPTKLGSIELANKIVMAPLTRCRATPFTDAEPFQPNALMAEYYGQRASCGLIIAEATTVTDFSGFYSEPALYTAKHAEGWKLTTDAVHANGGKIFIQLYHPGRAAHSTNSGGKQPVAPSAKACGNGHQINADFVGPAINAKTDYEVPRALAIEELPGIVQMFVNSAELAKDAGFDGVEIHGANGYLLDQFLRESANDRTDAYGGSLENRAKLMLEVVAAVTQVWPKEQVGVRLSPLNSYQDMLESDPVKLTEYMVAQLDGLGIGYLHLMRADFFSAQTGDVLTPARKHFKAGQLMVNMGLTGEEAEESLASGSFDLACFGSKTLANPDFAARTKAGAKLNEVVWSTAYSSRDSPASGYTDYPFMTADDIDCKPEQEEVAKISSTEVEN